eukprot:227558-Pleurochrysis_carterae.AAC.1
MRTLWAAQYSSSVGQLMARQRMPTAKATSGRVCVKQYRSAPTRDWYEAKSLLSIEREGLLSSACSTSLGSASDAGARVL